MEKQLRGTRPDLLDEFDARLTDIKRLFAEATGSAGDRVAVPRKATGMTRLDMAKLILWTRGLLDSEFDSDLFANPALNILISLYIGRAERRSMSTSSTCAASGVPTTTALRWINALARRNMIVRRSAPSDKRYTFLELSDDCARQLDHLLQIILDRFAALLAG